MTVRLPLEWAFTFDRNDCSASIGIGVQLPSEWVFTFAGIRIHFPTTVELPFFEQITSEYLKTEYRRGRPERSWERRKGRAAEACDCAVYALAAIHGLASHGISLDNEAERVELLRQTAHPAPVNPYQIFKSRFVNG